MVIFFASVFILEKRWKGEEERKIGEQGLAQLLLAQGEIPFRGILQTPCRRGVGGNACFPSLVPRLKAGNRFRWPPAESGGGKIAPRWLPFAIPCLLRSRNGSRTWVSRNVAAAGSGKPEVRTPEPRGGRHFLGWRLIACTRRARQLLDRCYRLSGRGRGIRDSSFLVQIMVKRNERMLSFGWWKSKGRVLKFSNRAIGINSSSDNLLVIKCIYSSSRILNLNAIAT